jgi:hypothetical protein
MNIWRIEYITGHSFSRFKIIEADTIRMSKVNGDLWFCSNDEIDADGNHIPKMIVAKGSYLSVERVKPKKEEIIIDLSEKMKKAMENTSVEPQHDHAKRMVVDLIVPNEETENENGWI